MKLFFMIAMVLFWSNSAFPDKVVIGTLPYNPPFEMQADKKKHMYGFDIEIMSHICRLIKKDCIYKVMSFSDLFSKLDKGQIDIAIGGITITNFRKKKFIFSIPYKLSYGRFLTFRSSKINTREDIQGKVVGVETGTLFKSMAKSLYENKVTVKEFKTIPDLMQSIINHNVDVILIDNAAALYWLTQNNDELKLIGKKIYLGIGIGVMSVKKNRLIINKINQAFLKMEENGAYLKVYQRYFNDRYITINKQP